MMNIIITNKLTSGQSHDIRNLIEVSKLHDNTKGIFFMEQENNEIKEFPCFYLMYNGSVLVSAVSVFIPDSSECEIYGITLPEYRKKGYFKRLYQNAMDKLKDFGIEKILFVNDPLFVEGAAILLKIGAILHSSDYLMRYNMRKVPEPKNIIRLESQKFGNTELFKGFLDEYEIGHSYCEHTRGTSVIFGFWVEKKYRNKGYGTELLLLMIQQLISENVHKILLHVNGANMYAHKMYYHNGFIHEEQIDFWLYNR